MCKGSFTHQWSIKLHLLGGEERNMRYGRWEMQYTAVQSTAVQYITVNCSAVHYRSQQCSALQLTAAQYISIQCSTTQCSAGCGLRRNVKNVGESLAGRKAGGRNPQRIAWNNLSGKEEMYKGKRLDIV